VTFYLSRTCAPHTNTPHISQSLHIQYTDDTTRAHSTCWVRDMILRSLLAEATPYVTYTECMWHSTCHELVHRIQTHHISLNPCIYNTLTTPHAHILLVEFVTYTVSLSHTAYRGVGMGWLRLVGSIRL